MRQIQDLHVRAMEPLVSPRALKDEFPADEKLTKLVAEARDTVRAILAGRESRILCIVGPCSIHDPVAATEYAQRLARLSREVADQMFVMMRVYFEKPRTTIGWKGLINDPEMDDSCNMREGLRIARRLLVDINRMGLPAATEMLDPITPQYIGDLISWTAIGARTTESQTHREMASGLSMPIGFKNTTDGNLQAAVNAVESARRPHSFLGITQDGLTAVVRTSGNPATHVVLRGGRNPNYDHASIADCIKMLERSGLEPRVLVDCSHAQTNKDYRKQPSVFDAIIEQICGGSRAIMGVMLESNLEAGNQPIASDRSKLRYGVSITDPCIDWATTEQCLTSGAASLAGIRTAASAG